MRVRTEETLIETIIEKVENQKVSLLITPEVLKILKQEKIDINGLFVLLALYDDYIGLLDIYDNNTQIFKILVVDYQIMVFHGFMAESDSDRLYELTEKGKDFVERIKPLMEVTDAEKMSNLEFKQLCQDYLAIFPKIKLPSGKYARTNIVEIEKKMDKWLKTYKPVFKKEGLSVTATTIIEATKSYVTRYARDNYRFMVTSSYFIQKNEKSALADEIQAIKDGLNATQGNIVTM